MSSVSTILPWAGLAGAGIALFFRDKDKQTLSGNSRVFLIPVLAAVAAFIGSRFADQETSLALGFLASTSVCVSLVSFLSQKLQVSGEGEMIFAFGIAAFLFGTELDLFTISLPSTLGGLVVGAAAGSLTGFFNGEKIGVKTTIVLFLAGIVSLLSRIGYREALLDVSPMICLVVVISLLIRLAFDRAQEGVTNWLSNGLAVTVIAGMAWCVLGIYLGEDNLALVATLGVFAAVVSVFAVPVDTHKVTPWGLTILIWFSLSTYSFSISFGLGTAIASLCGVGTLLVMRRIDLLPAAGVLATLSFYRLFRETNPLIVQPFDIGQHYAMIGFVFGVLTLFGMADALAKDRPPQQTLSSLARGAIAVLALVVVLYISSFFGAKGAIGIVLGLGIAPALFMLTAVKSSWSWVGAIALQCVALVAYKPLATELSLVKSEKIIVLFVVVFICSVLAAFIWAVDRRNREQTT